MATWRWCPPRGFQVGQTNGRGYIGLAAMIFGNWRPVGLFLGSTLFGYTQALPFRDGPTRCTPCCSSSRSSWSSWRCSSSSAAGVGRRPRLAVFAVLFFVWFLYHRRRARATSPRMAPYVTTLLVLALASQRLRMPAADGRIYRKGTAG